MRRGANQQARKNSAGTEFRRDRLNLIEGTGITLTVADDATDNEVDVTVASSSTTNHAPWPFNGSDGVLSFDGAATVLGLIPAAGVYTLTRDVYPAAGSSVGGTIKCAGFRFLVGGPCTLTGTLHVNGVNASGKTAGGAGGADQFLSAGSTGGAGQSGDAGGGTGSSTAGQPSLGGIGGTGGDSGTGRSGGAGGPHTGAGIVASSGSPQILNDMNYAKNGQLHLRNAVNYFMGGTGGGGGGSNGGGDSGGGGGGAGVLVAAATVWTGGGTISADGGTGGNATAGNAGGGGGGAGGVVVVIGDASAISYHATGGAGGVKQGSGTNGAAGQDGSVVNFVVV